MNDRISIGFSRRWEEEEWSSAPAALLAQHCEVMFHMTGEDLCVVDSGFPELFSQRLIASEVSRDLADFGRGQTKGVGCGYAETLHSRDPAIFSGLRRARISASTALSSDTRRLRRCNGKPHVSHAVLHNMNRKAHHRGLQPLAPDFTNGSELFRLQGPEQPVVVIKGQ